MGSSPGKESESEARAWDIVDLPANKKPIGCCWVYRIKYKEDESIERYKARLFTKGYTQREGIDYDETFAPVATMTTLRTTLAIAAKMRLQQLDVTNVFLHGDLEEEVYMDIPPGLNIEGENKIQVCKLRKSLYGLPEIGSPNYLIVLFVLVMFKVNQIILFELIKKTRCMLLFLFMLMICFLVRQRKREL
jgi:hypothetical protein